MIMVILFGSLLVPVVILFALPLVAISAFAALAVAGRQRDLSALIGLLMLIDIVDINATVLLTLAVATNAIVLLALVQHKIEAGADLRRVRTDAGHLIGEIAGGGKAIVVVVEQSELGGHEGVRDGRRRIRLAHGLMGPGGMDGEGHGRMEMIRGTVKGRGGIAKLAA
jgi:AcrB/AcrD/AcrF family